jgi:hypothetical protein
MAGVDWRLFGVATAAVATPLVACSYDWTVAPDAGTSDSGTDVSIRPEVDVVDASDASVADVATSGGDSSEMGTKDTGASIPEASSCAALTTDLQAARAAAIACTVGGSTACMTTVKDECGCEVAVGGDTTTENDFTAAVAAFEAADCSVTTPTALCPGTCPSVVHMCLFGAVDGSAVSTCVQ